MSLQLENITMAFREQETVKTVFSDFCLTLPDRGLAVICGPSGKGKTTLLRLMAGLCRPDSGTLKGETTVSFCFQEHRLFPQLTALENVTRLAWPKAGEPQRQMASEVLNKLGLGPAEQMLTPAKLSGGMAQRVSLARAFCAPADLLLLDEPLKELDAALRRTVMEIIVEQSRQRMTVVAAHEPDAWLPFHPIMINL